MMVVEPHFSSYNNSASVAVSSGSNAATPTFAGFEFEMLKKVQAPGPGCSFGLKRPNFEPGSKE